MPTGAFLITVDTEGDNIWARPRTVTTRNAEFLPRFQSFCEKFGLRPTYLTNWEMANAPAFVEFGGDVLRRGAGEIGMHLHAWNSPPHHPLTPDDVIHAPYLIEYPEPVIREKVKVMTDVLEQTFGVKMVSHRAGRWSFNEAYARALVDAGYRVDCSVTPGVSWQFCAGAPTGAGGSDYTAFPESAYFVDLADISRPGTSPLLELPLTILRTRSWPGAVTAARRRLARSFWGTVAMRKAFPEHQWLMPNGRNRDEMLAIVQACADQQRPYIELAIHSSELMPAGSPTFATADAVERLYEDLEALFSAASGKFAGLTLAQYRAAHAREPERVATDGHAADG